MAKNLVLEFSDGDEVLEGIRQACDEHNVQFGQFIEGKGPVKEFTLFSHDYQRQTFRGDYVLDVVSGQVKKMRDERQVDFRGVILRRGTHATHQGRFTNIVAGEGLRIVLHLNDPSTIRIE